MILDFFKKRNCMQDCTYYILFLNASNIEKYVLPSYYKKIMLLFKKIKVL